MTENARERICDVRDPQARKQFFLTYFRITPPDARGVSPRTNTDGRNPVGPYAGEWTHRGKRHLRERAKCRSSCNARGSDSTNYRVQL